MASRFYGLESFIGALDSWGLTDILLPFLLIFVLIFAILQKTEVLGKDKKNFNVVIALVVGLLVIIPHATNSYPRGYDVVDIINSALPAVALVIVAVLMLLILVGIWGAGSEWKGGGVGAFIAIVSLLAVIWIFGGSMGWWSGWNWFTDFFGEDAVALIVIILVFGIIIWFITRAEDQSRGEGVFKSIGDWFRRGNN